MEEGDHVNCAPHDLTPYLQSAFLSAQLPWLRLLTTRHLVIGVLINRALVHPKLHGLFSGSEFGCDFRTCQIAPSSDCDDILTELIRDQLRHSDILLTGPESGVRCVAQMTAIPWLSGIVRVGMRCIRVRGLR